MLVLRKPLNSPYLFGTAYRFLTTQAPNSYPIPYEPGSRYYDELINTAGHEGDFDTLHHLLNKRAMDGCFSTNNTFKFISTDLSVLEELLRTLACLDKGFTRKSAYDSLVSRLCKMQREDQALRVVTEMIRGGYGANACTIHPIISVLTRKKKMEEAWRVMELMRESQITPDLTAYNYFLSAFCFVGDLTSAAGVLTRIGEEGLGADTRTYDALVLGACRVGKVEGALVILRRMVDVGVSALYCTHGCVIGTLLNLGYHAQAVEFVLSYGGRDRGLDMKNFGALASRLITLERMNEAKFVLGEMRKRGLPMDHKLKDFYELHVKN